jgi:hypothetical protein
VRAAVALAILFAGCPCAGNQGVLLNAQRQPPRPDATFVTEKATLIVSTTDGIRRIALDGSGSTKLFGKLPHKDVPAVSVVDVSADFKTYLLSDSHTNLHVGDAVTTKTFEIPQLRKRMSSAALSPDGTKIAATRHSDYDSIRKSDDNDDAVFLIDIATRQVEVIPAVTKNWPTKIQWSADGTALWLSFAWERGSQWLTLADRKRTDHPYDSTRTRSPPAPLRADPRKPPACTQQALADKDPELKIVDDPNDPSRPARVVIKLEGRERGFHDYLADFRHPSLSPSCGYLVFEHRQKVWVTDLQGTSFGPIIDGSWLFFVP